MMRLGDENRKLGDLSGKLREMVVITTSVLLNSRLEYDVHSMFARTEGLSDSVIKAIGEGMPPPFADEVERIVYEANVQLVRTGTLTKSLRDEVIRLIGLTGLVQLISVVGLYVIVSYTINVMDVKLPKDFSIDPAKLQNFLEQGRGESRTK
jgi:4-carboxymuconolactone decarboxylase